MKKTNKIISFVLSAHVVATSVFASPASLQKRSNPIGVVTVPLDNKDKKSIDVKTIAKKTALFPLKALWWVTKPQLIMLGTGIFDLSLLGGYSIYKVNKFINENCPIVKETFAAIKKSRKADRKFEVLNKTNTLRFCADMYCCAEKLNKSQNSLGLTDSDFSGSTDIKFEDIQKAYEDCATGYNAVCEFLSHYVIFDPSLKSVLNGWLPGLPDYFVLSLSGYWIFAIDGDFTISGKSVRTLVELFNSACSNVINPIVQKQTASEEAQEETGEKAVAARLRMWWSAMHNMLEKNHTSKSAGANTELITQ